MLTRALVLGRLPPAEELLSDEATRALPLPRGVRSLKQLRYLLIPGLLTKWYPLCADAASEPEHLPEPEHLAQRGVPGQVHVPDAGGDAPARAAEPLLAHRHRPVGESQRGDAAAGEATPQPPSLQTVS